MSISEDSVFATGPTPCPRRRFLLVITAAAVGVLLLLSYIFNKRDNYTPSISRYQGGSSIFPLKLSLTSASQCKIDAELVSRYEFKGDVKYTRREIFAEYTEKEDLPLSSYVDMKLFDDGQPIRLTRNGPTTSRCSEPIVIKVPPSLALVDASHLDFGIATSMERLLDSMDTFAVWGGHTNCRFFVYLEPGAEKWKAVRKAQALGLRLFLFESGVNYENRYFLLVKLLAEHSRPETKWSCIMDDDTFFLSMPRLVNMLSKYDASIPHFIGSVSENDAQISTFGMIAYGGAGMFFSRPLLDKLGRIWDVCDAETGHGDGKIAYCVYKFTHAKLEIENGLHQLDIQRDPSGWFEAARSSPVSLHHWKSWFKTDMIAMTAVQESCGTECVLRQWRFADGWILTNGYSVIHHGETVSQEYGAFAMEKTWDDPYESFLRMLGPLRPKEHDKISFQLADAIVEGGQVRQIYIYRDEKDGDQVLELVWRMQ